MGAALAMLRDDGFEPGAAMRRRLAGFVATLRGAGFAIGHAEVADAARLLASRSPIGRIRLRAALKALFSSRHADLARFDELFHAFWRGRGAVKRARVSAQGGGAKSPRRFEAGPGGAIRPDDLPQSVDAEGAETTLADRRGRKGGASAQDALGAKDLAN